MGSSFDSRLRMGSSFDSGPYSFGTLLGRYERRTVVLPRFQRGYSWEKSQVSTFWNDLVGFEKLYSANPVSASYFLGPIVTQESDTEIVLLDGQQRLATATIFLAVLRNIARTLDQPGEHSGGDFARDIQAYLHDAVLPLLRVNHPVRLSSYLSHSRIVW